MDEKHLKVLQNCHTFLLQNIRPIPLIDRLYSSGILTSDDKDSISAPKTDKKTNRKLLNALKKAGPKAFSSFVSALNETSQQHVADHLLEELRKGTCVHCPHVTNLPNTGIKFPQTTV